MELALTSSVTKMSSKGQIVLPRSIRTNLSLTQGASFVVFTDGTNILLKPILKPNFDDFTLLCNKANEWANSVGMNQDDINDAIKQVRKNNKK